MTPDDRRLAIVANAITEGSPSVNASWALAKAHVVLVALDDFHNHDQRGQMTWEDETDPDEGDTE